MAEKGKLFLNLECQLINIDRMVDLESINDAKTLSEHILMQIKKFI